MSNYISKNPAVIELIDECFICLSGAYNHLGEPLTDLFLQTLLQAIKESRALAINCSDSTALDSHVYLYGGRLYRLCFKGEIIAPPEITVFQDDKSVCLNNIHTLIQGIYQGSAVLTATRPLSNNAFVERYYQFEGNLYTVTCVSDWTPAVGLEHKAGLFQ
jgi:hypothetical protein